MDPLPEEIQRFLDSNIESVEQLEILRVLGENPRKEWQITDLAREVQTRPEAAVRHLAALLSRGLLTAVTRGADPSYLYGPGSTTLEGLVGRLLQLYQERPVTMIKLLYARAGDPLRAFADSFRLRKEG